MKERNFFTYSLLVTEKKQVQRKTKESRKKDKERRTKQNSVYALNKTKEFKCSFFYILYLLNIVMQTNYILHSQIVEM